jgi:hypothetical protein
VLEPGLEQGAGGKARRSKPASPGAGIFQPRHRAAILLSSVALTWAGLILVNYYYQLWRLLLKGGWSLPIFQGDLQLPYFWEAFSRATTACAAAGLLTLSSIWLGMALFRLAGWKFTGWGESLPFAASAGLGLFANAGLLLAASGLYRPPVILFLAGLPLLGGLLYLLLTRAAKKRRGAYSMLSVSARRTLSTQGDGQSFVTEDAPSKSLGKRPKRFDKAWMGVVFLAMGMAFTGALAPEWEYDALWYHLQYPRLFLESGSLVSDPFDYVSLYPMTWELWFGYGLSAGGLFSGSLTSGAAQTAATLLHFSALPLTALAVYQMARQQAPSTSPWLAVALFVTIPTVIWEASTAYIDLALALHATLALYALLRYTQGRRFQWLALGTLNLGLGIASKHLSLLVLALAGLGLLLKLYFDDMQQHPQVQKGRLSSYRKAALKAVPPTLFLGLALVPALPWYLRSYMASGNPFFPEMFWLFGASPDWWDGYTQAGLQAFLDSFGRTRTFTNLLSLPWHMTIHSASYHGTLGPLFLILLPLLGFSRLRRGLPWLAGFVLLFIAMWASTASSFQMRFLVVITPVMAVLAAAAFARLQALARLAAWGKTGLQPYVQPALGVVMGALLLLNLPPFTALHERDRVGWDGWMNSVLHGLEWPVVVGAESRQDYLSRKLRSYPVWVYIGENIPNEARLLSWSGGDQFYTHHSRVWIYSTGARNLAWADIGPEGKEASILLPELANLRITHLVADRQFLERLEKSKGWQEWFERLYEDHHYALYRVNWEMFPW